MEYIMDWPPQSLDSNITGTYLFIYLYLTRKKIRVSVSCLVFVLQMVIIRLHLRVTSWEYLKGTC